MGLFDFFKPKKSFDGLLPAPQYLQYWRNASCSVNIKFDLSDNSYIEEAYKRCAPLADIVDRNASALVNGKWWVTDKEDNDISNKYPDLANLLREPNPLQSWSEMLTMLDVYVQLYGYAFLYKNMPFGVTDGSPTGLWALSPNHVKPRYTKKVINQSKLNEVIEGYSITIGSGEYIDASPEDVLIIRDTHQNLDFYNLNYLGSSRIEGLEYPIKVIMIAYEAMYSMLEDRGAMGIISSASKDPTGTTPLTNDEKESLHKELNAKYGVRENKRKFIISKEAISFQRISLDAKELQLLEDIESCVKVLSSRFEHPFELLGFGNDTKYSNKEVIEKSHYQNFIIPKAKMYSEKLTSFLGLSGTDRIYADYSGLPCLQQSVLELATSKVHTSRAFEIMYKNGVVSAEEWRLSMDMDEKVNGTTITANGSNEN